MSKKPIYATAIRRSEYRINYLPFNYYDFWITAKENENMRLRNKLRDYLHTPFDWDENVDIYCESDATVAAAAQLEKMNRATQTSERPNRHDQLARIVDERGERRVVDDGKHIHVENSEKGVQTKANLMKKFSKANARKKPSKENGQKGKKQMRPTKSASIQVSIEMSKKNQDLVRSRSAKSARNQIEHKEDQNEKGNRIVRSMSNMSIQTPNQWKLRDYSRYSFKSDKSKKKIVFEFLNLSRA